VLDFRYLTNTFDLARMRHAVRTAVDIMDDAPWSRLVPGNADLSSDTALDDWLLHNYRTAFHTCGTAKMGGPTDPEAVVDDHCRVRGVDGLRVADLSIMPVVGRGSMNPTAVMIGERAAELVAQ
jgi:choline dehydrogenase-like flavoprotein